MPGKHSIEVDGRKLILSNLEKVLFPGSKFTKGDLIGYYSAIAETILPHLAARPLTLKRFPEGVTGESFYEKNAPAHTPDWIETIGVARGEGKSDIKYILCNNPATLLWVTNLGDIEKHVLLARAPDLDCPTSMVFDLDPGEPANLTDCCRVALHLKEMFETLGLSCFAKVSGAKGLHLSLPLNTPVSYAVTQPFAKTVAELTTRQLPENVVFTMTKTLRRGKVLIDWSQNSDFKTTVCVYAMRAGQDGPFLSLPVTWDEVSHAAKTGRSNHLRFTPPQALDRVSRIGDLFEPMLTLRQQLPEAFVAALQNSSPRSTAKKPLPDLKMRDRTLGEYTAKRDHTKTSEPMAPTEQPSVTEGKGPVRFVIQKHKASHLHYDFRLQMKGVLRSWAVPKGLPTELKQTRLAMHVEDHPLAYENFEGNIPPGNYGAGTVMVWDHGTYRDQTGDPVAAFLDGKLHLTLSGRKLKGDWVLVRDDREVDGNRWLLIKAGESLPSISKKRDDTSALSGRTMRQIAADPEGECPVNRTSGEPLRPTKKKPARKNSVVAAFIEPMQCQPVGALPEGKDWAYENKFDGYRCMAVKSEGRIRLFSRTGKSLTTRFPAIGRDIGSMEGDFVLDGEVVVLDEDGRPSFQLIQNGTADEARTFFYAFDLLHHDGENLTEWPLSMRRATLETFLENASGSLRLSPILSGTAQQVLDAVRQLGMEGVVGKRLDSPYEGGGRTGAWVKCRTNLEQEFVIGGYLPGKRGFECLLIGVFEGKSLIFCAKLRNGFVPRIRNGIFALLEKLHSPQCPFANLPETAIPSRWGTPVTAENMKDFRWVKPQLVCQAAFVEWTDRGRLRHVSFVGMRDDKPARTVVRE